MSFFHMFHTQYDGHGNRCVAAAGPAGCKGFRPKEKSVLEDLLEQVDGSNASKGTVDGPSSPLARALCDVSFAPLVFYGDSPLHDEDDDDEDDDDDDDDEEEEEEEGSLKAGKNKNSYGGGPRLVSLRAVLLARDEEEGYGSDGDGASDADGEGEESGGCCNRRILYFVMMALMLSPQILPHLESLVG
jgi:hypothetical protein